MLYTAANTYSWQQYPSCNSFLQGARRNKVSS